MKIAQQYDDFTNNFRNTSDKNREIIRIFIRSKEQSRIWQYLQWMRKITGMIAWNLIGFYFKLINNNNNLTSRLHFLLLVQFNKIVFILSENRVKDPYLFKIFRIAGKKSTRVEFYILEIVDQTCTIYLKLVDLSEQ